MEWYVSEMHFMNGIKNSLKCITKAHVLALIRMFVIYVLYGTTLYPKYVRNILYLTSNITFLITFISK